MNNIISMSYDKDAFAISLLRIFKIQFAKDDNVSTVVVRIGIWRFFTSLAFTYASDTKFDTHGIS